MNVVDSCAWLEYFADGPNASFFAPAIEDQDRLLVPSITIFEVFKKVLQQRGEKEALEKAAMMAMGRVVDLDSMIALLAAKISVETQMPLADSVILATARAHRATVWTEDEHFKAIPGVKYVSRI
jgi:predicted nucleic acid-binding protein